MVSLPTPRTPDPMTAPPLKWGVIGTGWIAELFTEAVHAHTRQRVVAAGSRSQEKADSFAQRFGVERGYGSYEAMVADDGVDVVYVATPHSEHLDNALLAIAAGKHVLVEKAFTRTTAEAQHLLAAAKDAGVALLEAMWTRFLPSMDIVRQVLADGLLGEIETVFADHGQWFAEDPDFRLYDPAKAGGAMLDLGVYPVSFMHFALGTPGRALALGSAAFTGVDRQVSAVFDGFSSHPHAHALLSTTLAARTPATAAIAGSYARIELPGAFYSPQTVTLHTRDDVTVVSDPPPIAGHEGLCYEAAHLATMISEGRTESDLLPWSETLAVMTTMENLLEQVGLNGA